MPISTVMAFQSEVVIQQLADQATSEQSVATGIGRKECFEDVDEPENQSTAISIQHNQSVGFELNPSLGSFENASFEIQEREDELFEYLKSLVQQIVKTTEQQPWMYPAARYLLKQLRLLENSSEERSQLIQQLEDYLFQHDVKTSTEHYNVVQDDVNAQIISGQGTETVQRISQQIDKLLSLGLQSFVFGDEPCDFSQFGPLANDVERLYNNADCKKLAIVYLKLFRRTRCTILPDSILEGYYLARIDQKRLE